MVKCEMILKKKTKTECYVRNKKERKKKKKNKEGQGSVREGKIENMRKAQSVFLFIDPQGIGTSINKLEEKGIYSPSSLKRGEKKTDAYIPLLRTGRRA